VAASAAIQADDVIDDELSQAVVAYIRRGRTGVSAPQP
jgi:hypothetical protein